MDIAIILTIFAIVVTILSIMVTLYVWTHSPDEFKKGMQKLKSLFKAPSLLGKFVKYSIFFLIIGAFIYVSIIQAHKVDFNPQIYNVIGFWGLCFIISIAMILTVEQDKEKGDKYTQPS